MYIHAKASKQPLVSVPIILDHPVYSTSHLTYFSTLVIKTHNIWTLWIDLEVTKFLLRLYTPDMTSWKNIPILNCKPKICWLKIELRRHDKFCFANDLLLSAFYFPFKRQFAIKVWQVISSRQGLQKLFRCPYIYPQGSNIAIV